MLGGFERQEFVMHFLQFESCLVVCQRDRERETHGDVDGDEERALTSVVVRTTRAAERGVPERSEPIRTKFFLAMEPVEDDPCVLLQHGLSFVKMLRSVLKVPGRLTHFRIHYLTVVSFFVAHLCIFFDNVSLVSLISHLVSHFCFFVSVSVRILLFSSIAFLSLM